MNDSKLKRQVTITLEPEVLEYVDRRAACEDRSRSQTINYLLKQEARSNGSPIVTQRNAAVAPPVS